MFERFNIWFDALREPWRFLFFLFVLMGWVVPLELGNITNILELRIVGTIWLVITAIFALSRMKW